MEGVHRLGGERLYPAALLEIALGAKVALDPAAAERMGPARRLVEAAVAEGRAVYGVTTGFGQLASVSIPAEETARLQVNLVRSHAAGVGEPLPRPVVRALLALRAHTLAKGHSGVRPVVVERLVDFLNADLLPVVPAKGSVGASGDLAPLAHVALALIGEGEVELRGERMPAGAALAALGLEPLALSAKEGLALTNGTQLMTADLALLVGLGGHLVRLATGVAALSLECLRGIPAAFTEELVAARPHPGAVTVAEWLRADLAGSRLTTEPGAVRMQDPYSLRCLPQVHGTVLDALRTAAAVLAVEIESATDNPLLFPAIDKVISGGNFHGQPIAFQLDAVGLALSYLAGMAERRVERLLNPSLSGLPPFLTATPGVSSGLMLVQYTAAALTSENKVLAHPASADSIPTSANQEDFVSMGPAAGAKALAILENVRRVVAIEWLVAAQAAEFAGRERLSPAGRERYERLRAVVPPYADGVAAADIARVDALVDAELWQALREGKACPSFS